MLHSTKRKRSSSSSLSTVSFWCAAASGFTAEVSLSKSPNVLSSDSEQPVQSAFKPSVELHSHHQLNRQLAPAAYNTPHTLHNMGSGTVFSAAQHPKGHAQSGQERQLIVLDAAHPPVQTVPPYFKHGNSTHSWFPPGGVPGPSEPLRSPPNKHTSGGSDISYTRGPAHRTAAWKAAAEADDRIDQPHAWDTARPPPQPQQQGGWARVGLAPESNAQKAGKLQALRLELQAAEKLVSSLRGMVADMVASMQGCPSIDTDPALVFGRISGAVDHGAAGCGLAVPIQCVILSQEVTEASVVGGRLNSECGRDPAPCKEATSLLFSVLDSDDDGGDM